MRISDWSSDVCSSDLAIREEDHPRYAAAMAALSDAAFAAYRGLVYDTPGFKNFFRAMTPIAEIATLKIGSRPSSRTKSSAIEELRAIPWVFRRSEERCVGESVVRTGRSRWSAYP